MKDLGICVEKECDKQRFLEYYVCAEHFVVYAAARYTESMLVSTETAAPLAPPTYPDFRMYPEESPHNGRQQESPPTDSAEREAPKRAPISWLVP